MYINNNTKLYTMKKLLYWDMEWVPMTDSFKTLQEQYPEHAAAWGRRCKKWQGHGKFEGMSDDAIYEQEAGFYPEFSKIICISLGYYKGDELAMDSFYGDDEREILSKVHDLLSKTAGKYDLCGHSIKRFDMPYLAKRMAIHGMSIPYDLNNGSKKPWDLTAVDIAEEWGFGCNAEKFTPLDWMCAALNVKTPKDGISGGDVKDAYYKEGRIEDIKNYCEADVRATAECEQKICKVTNPYGR